MRNKGVNTMNRLPPVSSLMSPPEPKPHDSFNRTLSPCVSQQSSFTRTNILPPISDERKRKQSEMMDLPSPPVTPYVENKKQRPNEDEPVDRESGTAGNNINSRDPVLFPRSDEIAPAIPNDEPLFGSDEATVANIDEHIAANSSKLPEKVQPPSRGDYLYFWSWITTQYNANRAAYAREERARLDRQLAMMKQYQPIVSSSSASKLKKIAPAPSKRSPGGSSSSSNGISKPSRPPRARRSPKSTPKFKPRDSFDPLPKPTRVIGANRDETDYRLLPDYSPPIETLRGNTKGLKADWKGQLLDLSADPDRHALEPAEVSLAATLRLSCASYLASKRRIFEARVNALKAGKEFRKTDAQQACKIDVNKASKLWTAYERVGWLAEEHFRKYL
ncbi:SWIRM domain-containing protein [Arthroderma uncinatum]|uniref:SWIRM domain-containing protein n=1 Tax=Arthroderma uncinatum TaxID=74035 RepID=UPI00144A7665|nr:SWIRM domain-containing protein [Arthroderma uncinatum]KAF3483583.1 SWIRM domain-containing protein [Arthroderma uncinatum]